MIFEDKIKKTKRDFLGEKFIKTKHKIQDMDQNTRLYFLEKTVKPLYKMIFKAKDCTKPKITFLKKCKTLLEYLNKL